jgi:hypothetical protein
MRVGPALTVHSGSSSLYDPLWTYNGQFIDRRKRTLDVFIDVTLSYAARERSHGLV